MGFKCSCWSQTSSDFWAIIVSDDILSCFSQSLRKTSASCQRLLQGICTPSQFPLGLQESEQWRPQPSVSVWERRSLSSPQLYWCWTPSMSGQLHDKTLQSQAKMLCGTREQGQKYIGKLHHVGTRLDRSEVVCMHKVKWKQVGRGHSLAVSQWRCRGCQIGRYLQILSVTCW